MAQWEGVQMEPDATRRLGLCVRVTANCLNLSDPSAWLLVRMVPGFGPEEQVGPSNRDRSEKSLFVRSPGRATPYALNPEP